MTDIITCSTFEEGTITEEQPLIMTKVNEGTCSDSKYTFTLEGIIAN